MNAHSETQTHAGPQTGQQHHSFEPAMRPSEDILGYLREYAREKPDVAAAWCFGIGFVLGWKLKPW